MDIPLNANVHCTDGRCGRSTYVIVNPATDQVTHLVVREQWPSRTERMVPVSWIVATAREVIILGKSREVFIQLEPFTQTDFVRRDVPRYASDPRTLLWPYLLPASTIVEDEYRRIPAGELAVRRGAKVEAVDGRVGQVDEFLIAPASGSITHLVLREGHLWGEKLITIPVSEIERIEEKTVYLKLNKEGVEALPAVPVREW